MDQHISYAMRNTEATSSWVFFNSPSELKDWSFLAIELIIVTGFFLALLHAYRFYKKSSSPSALLTLVACLLYGLCIDILSYYTVNSFWHGEFSVMFLNNRLPLYIALFYPAYMYHNYMLIHRYNFPIFKEAVVLGFFDGLMYLIFDNLGPMLGWWVWDTNAPTNQPFLNSVSLTSYHWLFTFTIAFSLINRVICWDWVNKGVSRRRLAAGIVGQPIIVILLGTALFIPYNLFAKSMPPFDMLPWDKNLALAALIDVVLFSLAAWWLFIGWYKPRQDRDVLLLVFPFLYIAGLSYIYIAKFDHFFRVTPDGLSDGLAVGNLLAVVLGIVGSVFIIIISNNPANETPPYQ